MIVKCEQCQTRFKIPDDKVTDKGVRVRCTRCTHTFRVTRDMAQPAAAPEAAPPPLEGDPFARFGTSQPSPMAEVTRPGVFALGVEATRPPPAAPAGSFDFSSLAPPTTLPAMPAVQAFAPAMPAATATPAVPAFPPSSPPASANPFDFAAVAPPAAPAPSAFDFSTFAAPTQQVPALAPARPAPIAAAPAPPAFDFSRGAVPAAPPAAFDFSTVAPPAPAAAPADNPFDFAAGAPPAAAAPAYGLDLAAVPAPSYAPPAFDFAAVAGTSASAPVSSAPFDFSAPPGGGADNFFANTPSSIDVAGLSPGDARAMFDLPSAAAPADLLDVPAPPPEPVAPAVAPPSPSAAPGPAPAPAPAPAPRRAEPERARRPSAVGIVVNVAIAAVLVLGLVVVGSAYLNEGKVSAETLSLENLKNTFAPSVDFVANDVSNGLYETRQGRSVFFVRGEVVNRSEGAVKVLVKAEIVEEGKVVRSAESFAGEPATPEELYLVDGADALEALRAKVERRALVVPPGAAATFVVPFVEYPPDLKDFRVRVSARAIAAEATAVNP